MNSARNVHYTRALPIISSLGCKKGGKTLTDRIKGYKMCTTNVTDDINEADVKNAIKTNATQQLCK